jgi:hypothetical protein
MLELESVLQVMDVSLLLVESTEQSYTELVREYAYCTRKVADEKNVFDRKLPKFFPVKVTESPKKELDVMALWGTLLAGIFRETASMEGWG